MQNIIKFIQLACDFMYFVVAHTSFIYYIMTLFIIHQINKLIFKIINNEQNSILIQKSLVKFKLCFLC